MNKLTRIGLIALVVVAALWFVFRKSDKAPEATEVTTQMPVAKDISLVREADGEDEATVLAKAKERLVKAYDETVPWLKKCAQKNDRDAQLVLARMYEEGNVLPQDLVEAYKWFSIAASQGEANAEHAKDSLRAKLSADQLTEADKRISDFSVEPKTTKG